MNHFNQKKRRVQSDLNTFVLKTDGKLKQDLELQVSIFFYANKIFLFQQMNAMSV